MSLYRTIYPQDIEGFPDNFKDTKTLIASGNKDLKITLNNDLSRFYEIGDATVFGDIVYQITSIDRNKDILSLTRYGIMDLGTFKVTKDLE